MAYRSSRRTGRSGRGRRAGAYSSGGNRRGSGRTQRMGFAAAPRRRAVTRRATRGAQTVKIVVEHAAASPMSRPAVGLMNTLVSKLAKPARKAKH